MSAAVGRDVTVTWKGSAILGLREKKINHNDEPIDITTSEDAGVQVLLNASGQDSIELSLTGVTKDDVLKTDWFSGGSARQGALVVTYPNGATLSGTFQISNFKEGVPYKEAITFETTMKSTGAFVFTPGS